jgi:lysophospholipase L1-like esterase
MRDLRICFVGDSFVNGTGDPTYLGWAGRICVAAQQQGLEITNYNLGIRRQTSRDIAQRWQTEVSARLPGNYDGRIVFSFGVNDTTIENGKERVAFAESIENARTILQRARSFFPTIMVGPPPILEEEQNQRIACLSGQFALVCEALEIPYLETFTPLQHIKEWREEVASNDGAHPRDTGYAALARLIQNWSAWQAWLK